MSCKVCVYGHCWSTTRAAHLAPFVFTVTAGQQQELHVLHCLYLQSLLVNNKSCTSCSAFTITAGQQQELYVLLCVYSHCWSATIATCLSLFVFTVTAGQQQVLHVLLCLRLHTVYLLTCQPLLVNNNSCMSFPVCVYSHYCFTTVPVHLTSHTKLLLRDSSSTFCMVIGKCLQLLLFDNKPAIQFVFLPGSVSTHAVGKGVFDLRLAVGKTDTFSRSCRVWPLVLPPLCPHWLMSSHHAFKLFLGNSGRCLNYHCYVFGA